MVATDAPGKGSRRYGRTSDHIEALDVVLADGSDWTAETPDHICARDDLAGGIHRQLRQLAVRNYDEIERVFPAMNRGSGLLVLTLDPALADLDRSGYAPFSEGSAPATPTEAFLAAEIARGAIPALPAPVTGHDPFILFEHCTGRATDPTILLRWQGIFNLFGLAVQRQPVSCCGMAGIFGHEADNQDMSRALWDRAGRRRWQGWAPPSCHGQRVFLPRPERAVRRPPSAPPVEVLKAVLTE